MYSVTEDCNLLNLSDCICDYISDCGPGLSVRTSLVCQLVVSDRQNIVNVRINHNVF